MANGDGVMTDHYLLHQQSGDTLTVVYVERLDIGTQAVEKCRKRLRYPQVSSLIRDLSMQRFELGLQALLMPAQLRHPATQFVQGEQIFLIRSQ
jgi:hypothetical protein